MTYEAKLTNPVPVGLVHARGTVGPWRRDDLPATPLDGEYTFTDADLSTINGIGGTLSSTGTFTGQLTAINAIGEAQVPDFNLDLGGKPVPLTAKFNTLVDGTDGTTILNRVDAKILDTAMIVSGAITNLEGPGRHEVSLKVEIADGRIENLFALAMDTPKPVMTGDVALTATLLLPPGKPRVRDRIRLAGTFGLGRARFTDAEVQAKLTEFSRRSQGKDRDEQLGRVMTSLKGRFELANALMHLPNFSFKVPGADVALAGTYNLTSEEMNFLGTLRMEATVSKAVGGFKSIFIRPFDSSSGKTALAPSSRSRSPARARNRSSGRGRQGLRPRRPLDRGRQLRLQVVADRQPSVLVVVEPDLHRLRGRDQRLVAEADDVVVVGQAAAADGAETEPDLERVAVTALRAEVDFGARQDEPVPALAALVDDRWLRRNPS